MNYFDEEMFHGKEPASMIRTLRRMSKRGHRTFYGKPGDIFEAKNMTRRE